MKSRWTAPAWAALLLGVAVLVLSLARRSESPGPPPPLAPSQVTPPAPPEVQRPREAGSHVEWIRTLDPARPLTQALSRLDDLLALERAVENEDPETIRILIAILDSAALRSRQLAALLLGRLKRDDVQSAFARNLKAAQEVSLRFAILWAVGIQEFRRDETPELRAGFWKDRLAEAAMAEGLPWSEAYAGQYDPKVLEGLEGRAVASRSIVPHCGDDPKQFRIDHAGARGAALDILLECETNPPRIKNLLLRLMNKQWFQDECAEALARTFLAESRKGFAERYLELLGLNETSANVTRVLIDYLSASPDADLMKKAVLALATKNRPEAREWFLRQYAKAVEVPEKRLAILGLGRTLDAESFLVLERVTRDEGSAELRSLAVSVLARYPNSSSGTLLRRLAAEDVDASVRLAVLRAVGEQEKWRSPDVPLLKTLSERDPDTQVRAEAAKWLQAAAEAPKE